MQQTRLKNRKDQILSIALELVQSKGFQSLSYQDLSARLGITKASIHHHFPKKADLGVALCDTIRQWHDYEYQKIRAMQAPVLEKLDFYINSSVRKACGEGMVCPLSSLHADAALLPDPMLSAIKSLDEQEIDFMEELLEEGLISGEFNFSGSARAQAMLSVIAYKGALQYLRSHGTAFYQQVLSQLTEQLVGRPNEYRRNASTN